MMMGNAQIRTHTHFPSGRPRTHNLAQRAKRENRSKSIGGCGLGNTEIKLEVLSRRASRVCTIIQHFWGERAHTHSWPRSSRETSPGVQLWNQTLARQLRARVSTILITLPFSCSSSAQLLIHLSFSPLFPFLSSAHVFFLIFFFFFWILRAPVEPRWDDDDLADLDHYTFLLETSSYRLLPPWELRSIFLNCSANG